ncbi:hypothetical protein [Brevundimonas sp. LM2]|uniref:hypothetical protein n=1 Tax=Brevundimonas sp. LM2 TaxID=1938605 RepID=UPI001237369B|nr:hypothetical protein [Brevundimonas sp. LM2]
MPTLSIDRFRKRPEKASFDAHPPLDDRERFVVRTVTWGYALITATQKVALLLFPGTALQIALLLTMGLIGILCWRGGMGIDVRKAMLYLAFGAAAGVTALANNITATTLPSMLFVYAVYSIFIFSVPLSKGAYGKILDNIVLLGAIAAGLVYMDWAVQLVGMEMPSMHSILPEQFRFFNYIYIQPIEWGSPWYKPNGYFFLETSFVSQFTATALVIEICRRQRLLYLAVTASGLLLSFGGTGLALLALSLPVVFFYVRPRLLLIGIMMLPLLFGVALKAGLVDNIETRTGEFSQEGKSGNQRFTKQGEVIAATLMGPTREALVGIGPGRMPQRLNLLWIPATKVLVEYGLFVSVLFWVFYFYSIFGRGVPIFASWVVAMQYLFLNGSFLVPLLSVICVIIAGMYRIEDPEKVASAASRRRAPTRLRRPIRRPADAAPAAETPG